MYFISVFKIILTIKNITEVTVIHIQKHQNIIHIHSAAAKDEAADVISYYTFSFSKLIFKKLKSNLL